MGIFSDLFPIFGYRKGPYVIIATVIGVLCHAIIALTTAETLPVNLAVAGQRTNLPSARFRPCLHECAKLNCSLSCESHAF